MPDSISHQIDKLARRERGRLTAGLVLRLGAHRIELVEDMVQEAVLAAISQWPCSGLPERPAAWLSKVAYHKAVDRLRREGREAEFREGDEETEETIADPRLKDPELKLVFLCANPALSEQDRLMLTLKTVSGFTAREIATVFLMTEQAVAQRLARAKRKLRQGGALLVADISRFEIKARIETVLKSIYLMFAVGYGPRFGAKLILQDIAEEALRLIESLLEDKDCETAEAYALAALIAFHCSRFNTRVDGEGKLLLLKDQNREKWDKALIVKALEYMTKSKNTGSLSIWHLEAVIASVHACAPSWDATDWSTILKLYQTLLRYKKTAVAQIGLAVALAYAGQIDEGMRVLDSLTDKAMKTYAPYHLAYAEIYEKSGETEAAEQAFKNAQNCQFSKPVADFLEAKLF